MKFRARQNVVFEHGLLLATLGRDRVFALKKGDIELPGDFSGVIYTPMEDNGEWKNRLRNELKVAGLIEEGGQHVLAMHSSFTKPVVVINPGRSKREGSAIDRPPVSINAKS